MPKFVLEWDKELGFRQNPFQDEIFEPIDYFYAGNDKIRKNLNLFIINQKSFCMVQGGSGTGKTALLVWLEYQLKQADSKIIVNLIRAKDVRREKDFISSILRQTGSSINKVISKFSKKKEISINDIPDIIKNKTKWKRYILILDEIHTLGPKKMDIISELLKLKNFQLITSVDKNIEAKSDLKLLGKEDLLVKLNKMTNDDLKKMTIKRIEAMGGSGIWPFKDENIRAMAKKSEGNPREYLKLCQERAIKLSLDAKAGKLKRPIVATAQKPIEDQTPIEEQPVNEEEYVNQEAVSQEQEVKKSVINLGFIKIVKESPASQEEVEPVGDFADQNMVDLQVEQETVQEPEESAVDIEFDNTSVNFEEEIKEEEKKSEKKEKKHDKKHKEKHKKEKKHDKKKKKEEHSKEKELKKQGFMIG